MLHIFTVFLRNNIHLQYVYRNINAFMTNKTKTNRLRRKYGQLTLSGFQKLR